MGRLVSTRSFTPDFTTHFFWGHSAMTKNSRDEESRLSRSLLTHKIYSGRLVKELPEEVTQFLDDLFDKVPSLNAQTSLGFLQSRLAWQEAMKSGLANLRKEGARFKGTRFVTFSFLDGHRALDDPMPTLRTQAGRIDRLCRQFKLSCIFWPDIEIISFPGLPQPLLSYHHHGIVWGDVLP